MGYMHINNTYKDQTILLFKECYALEKIHGTSANISWRNESITFSSGGESHSKFCSLFDKNKLSEKLQNRFGNVEVIIYGEAYGGSQQKMSETYGKDLKFIVFDVYTADKFLDVPDAEMVASELGLEFVSYCRIPATIESLNSERDKPSVQAVRNGITTPKPREGVVLRPIYEFTNKYGERVISKHKGSEFAERKNVPEISKDNQKVLDDANSIAEEWVVANRLDHVLDKLGNPTDIKAVGSVIQAMIEDVLREANGEIVVSKEVRKAISNKTAVLFTNRIKGEFK